jgi:sulfane dehydrogenase subunit SoxC
MAHTRFGMDWKWEGQECALQSRCTDEVGQVQPTRAEIAKYLNHPTAQGVQGLNNTIQPWKVASDGTVHNGLA